MITIKVGNTARILQFTFLQDSKGTPYDLTDADINFYMIQIDDVSEPKIIDIALVPYGDPTEGVVRYEWVSTDLDTVGLYNAEVTVDLVNGTRVSFPETDFLEIRIVKALKEEV